MASLPAPFGTCYSWQWWLENGRQWRNFVCSGLGLGQTSGLQLSGVQDQPPTVHGMAPGALQHPLAQPLAPHTRADSMQPAAAHPRDKAAGPPVC